MNIRIIEIREEPSVSAAWGTVSNPAVLTVTDWNIDAMSLLPRERFPIVLVFAYSKIKINTVPIKIKITVVDNTILE